MCHRILLERCLTSITILMICIGWYNYTRMVSVCASVVSVCVYVSVYVPVCVPVCVHVHACMLVVSVCAHTCVCGQCVRVLSVRMGTRVRVCVKAAVPLWLEHQLADRKVTGSMPSCCCCSLSKELYSHCSSPPSCINGDLGSKCQAVHVSLNG